MRVGRSRKPVIAARRRDGHQCKRCRRGPDYGLIGHHVHAYADGGSDNISNIDTLCQTCHREWHYTCEGAISYEKFLELPLFQFFVGHMNFIVPDGARDTDDLREWQAAFEHLLGRWRGIRGMFDKLERQL